MYPAHEILVSPGMFPGRIRIPGHKQACAIVTIHENAARLALGHASPNATVHDAPVEKNLQMGPVFRNGVAMVPPIKRCGGLKGNTVRRTQQGPRPWLPPQL